MFGPRLIATPTAADIHRAGARLGLQGIEAYVAGLRLHGLSIPEDLKQYQDQGSSSNAGSVDQSTDSGQNSSFSSDDPAGAGASLSAMRKSSCPALLTSVSLLRTFYHSRQG